MSNDLTKMFRNAIEGALEYQYVPTEDQRVAKSQLWTRMRANGLTPPDTPDIELATTYVSDSRITAWWSVPGFSKWLFDINEFAQRVEHLAQVALDQLYSMLTDPNTPPAVRGQSVKLIMELGGKMPKNKVEAESEDEVIGKMSRSELEEYITKKMPVLVTSKKKED